MIPAVQGWEIEWGRFGVIQGPQTELGPWGGTPLKREQTSLRQTNPQCKQPGVLSCYAARSLGESSRRGIAALLEIAGTSTRDSTAGKFPVYAPFTC